jgi:mannitol-specific phosphotransferase system IIBC component
MFYFIQTNTEILKYVFLCFCEVVRFFTLSVFMKIRKEQTTQWSKEKVQKDKQRSTKHTHKTKDRITRTPLKPGVNSGAPEGYTVPALLVAPN